MNKQHSYDITSPQSILKYARGLSGKTLEEAADLTGYIANLKDKGDLGKMVERYYFNHVPPNKPHTPDFEDAGIELKTTGVIKNKKGAYRAKERLVLSMIDYVELSKEEWSHNSLMKKSSLILLLFYYYQKIEIYKRRFVYQPLLWTFPELDLEIIRKDWDVIHQKIMEGKAHELSEGDTFYLSACRKGTGGPNEALRVQPFSDIRAKSRAFSLKQSYVNTILDGHAEEVIITNLDDARLGVEASVEKKLSKYYGKTIDEISQSLGFFKQGPNDKSFSKSLVMRMLGTNKKTLPELEKAGIETKILTLNKSGTPKEYLQFPTFDYMKIVQEKWTESSFYQKLEKKFLFVIFKTGRDKIVRFEHVMFWNMPYNDRLTARRVWETTKERIIDHQAQSLPKISEGTVAHVRPHGANNTTALFPTPQGILLPRQGFWLNTSYIANQIRSQADK